jgi:hypothetical protein
MLTIYETHFYILKIDMMNPFNSILGDLAGPFIKAYDSTFGVIKSVKEAYAVLKKG